MDILTWQSLIQYIFGYTIIYYSIANTWNGISRFCLPIYDPLTSFDFLKLEHSSRKVLACMLI